MSRRNLLSVFALFLLNALPTSVAAAKGPVVVPWAVNSYGPDGPWNAVYAVVGQNSPATVDLLPGGLYESYIMSPYVCNTTMPGVRYLDTKCVAGDAKLYDHYKSNTSQYDPAWGSPGGVNGPPNYQNGSTSLVGDVFTTGVDYDGTYKVQDVGLTVANSSWNTLANGTLYPRTIGSFSLGAPELKQTFHAKDGPDLNKAIYVSGLYTGGTTQSASVGLHIGAANLGYGGSMVIGGYDNSRVYGKASSLNYASISGPAQPTFGITLKDIGFASYQNGSPFTYKTRDGMLSEGNTTMNAPLTVGIDHTYPYMALPPSTCKAITKDLPVTYDNGLGLYVWNVNDPAYTRIVGSASYLTFTFDTTSGSDLIIKAPWSLFNLTLDRPITAQRLQYFPCAPLNSSVGSNTYTLGRAFLQAAFFGVNWMPEQGDGKWFLAQAPGPQVGSGQQVQSLSYSASTITGTSALWEDSWKGWWNTSVSRDAAPPASSPTPPPPTPSSGLSTGAIAGIVVGGIAGLAAIAAAVFLLMRKRGAGLASPRAGYAPPAYAGEGDAKHAMQQSSVGELSGHSHYDYREMPGSEAVFEMDGGSNRFK